MRNRILEWMVTMAASHRRAVLLVTVILTLVLGAASEHLKMDTRWSALLPESIPVVKEFVKIDEHFIQPSNLIVAVSGPDSDRLEGITDEITATLRETMSCGPKEDPEVCKGEKRYLSYIYGKQPEQWVNEHLLALAKPNDARRMAARYRDPRLLPFLEHLNDDLEEEYADSEGVKNNEPQVVASLDAVQGFVRALDRAGSGETKPDEADRAARDLTVGRPYMFSLDGGMSLVMLASIITTDDMETIPLVDKEVERRLKPLQEKYPDYRIERTGMWAVGRDEMDSVGVETQIITLLAFVLLFLILAWNFKSFITPAVALFPIVIGITWTLGVIALVLGTLNMLTAMIMVILLGLGIDFSIHIANRFAEETAAGKSIEEALRLSVAATGQGVVTGALTTAVAFYTLMLADTKGVFEFGFCSGTGVLMTLVAVLWILPAMMAWRAKRAERKKKTPVGSDFSALGRLVDGISEKKTVVIVVGVLVTILGILAGTKLSWEYNFMELEPEGLRSIALQDEIVERYKLSATPGMLTAGSPEQSRKIRKAMKKKRMVGDVDDVSLYLSRPDFEKNLPHIRKLKETASLTRAPLSFAEAEKNEAEAKALPPSGAENGDKDAYAGLSVAERRERLTRELDRLWANVVEIQALSFTGGQDRVVEKCSQLVATRSDRDKGMLKQLVKRFQKPENIRWEKLEEFGRAFQSGVAVRVKKMVESEAPVTLAMIPEDIRARYVSKTGKDGFLVNILPRRNLYEREDQELFLAAVNSVHPRVTGTPQMMLQMSLATMEEGKTAVIVAMLVILAILLIDFRRPLPALLAFLPLLSGMSIMLGMMYLLGQKLNYMNMIAFPVIIGIGVDDGIHFLHRYLQEGKGRMRQAATGVGRAMLMTSLTTMIGFGSLMLYLLRGMASMGLVLFVGVAACLLVTFTLLPALAKLFENRLFGNED